MVPRNVVSGMTFLEMVKNMARKLCLYDRPTGDLIWETDFAPNWGSFRRLHILMEDHIFSVIGVAYFMEHMYFKWEY